MERPCFKRLKGSSLGDFDQKDWAWFADQSQQIIKQLEEENTLEDLSTYASSLCEIIIVGEETIGKAKLRELKTVWEAIDMEEGYANVEECGWRRLQEIWRKGQKQCLPLSID